LDFGNIVNRGKKAYQTKKDGGEWGRCEECGERRVLFPYIDSEDQVWLVCDECVDFFIKDEIL